MLFVCQIQHLANVAGTISFLRLSTNTYFSLASCVYQPLVSVCRLIMKADMDKIITLSDRDSPAELQKYLSSLTDDQVILFCQFIPPHFLSGCL